MKLVTLSILCVSLLAAAEDARSPQLLAITGEKPGAYPAGWGGGPRNLIRLEQISPEGEPAKWVARFERTAADGEGFSVLTKAVPVDFRGERIEMRGFLKTADVSTFAGLWMRQDGSGERALAFDNMQTQDLKGTTEWKEYSISLPLHKRAKDLYFGVLVAGTGSAWARDLQILVDGKPISSAPVIPVEPTALDKDHEFDSGSKISAETLTAQQIDNLLLLGKVWGFVKYHHPRIAAGEKHFDYELFRVAPAVLAATDRPSAQKAIFDWVTGLGKVEECKNCARISLDGLHLDSPTNWISDENLLGKELSASLANIYKNRFSGPEQFYVGAFPSVGNPVFRHELAYERMRFPDAGYRLLAVYRFANIVEYWFPYRNQLSDNWDSVQKEFIPRVMLAKDQAEYSRELMALIAKAHDTHANLWGSIDKRPPVGDCRLPVVTRFVEKQAVVVDALAPDALSTNALLKRGDVILALDGTPIPDLVTRWTPYYAASNEPTRLRDMGAFLTRGTCGEAAVRVMRGGETLELKAQRVAKVDASAGRTHDRPGEAFQKISHDVAYLKLGSVKQGEASKYVKAAEGTKALILDLRNYPSAFMVFELGSLLVEKRTPFVTFTTASPSNPGVFSFGKTLAMEPQSPRYSGKVYILIDEITQSSSEYHAMAFRAVPGATVIGSTTAGADGNVSQFPLPGGLRSMVSGIGVFYPDHKPTQRIGIVPDVEVRPTIAGIAAGRDEVLEEALRRIAAK